MIQTNVPTGPNVWTLLKPYCGDENMEMSLFINACDVDTEFACHDGGCLGIINIIVGHV